ncbi:MAG: exodeoxyribonuclease III [Flavobacteriia bacterium]|nr:exodeoxyribonuclease III [Flavobacteriia bacterium]NBY39891.1 exodeoxyribonuclease III [Flavobacteriia bacterium]
MNILSFNVNGIRAISSKTFIQDMQALQPDIICLQETKATVAQVKEALIPLEGYHIFANEAERKGYSGTAILTKENPLSISYDMQIPEHDHEGRVVCAEYPSFFLVTVYVPNSGSELARLPYRQSWDRDFLAYLKELEQTKPVLVCGDFNVAHQPMDLSRPKENYNKAAGYMQEEIDGMNAFVAAGFHDTYRYLNPSKIEYSWWSYRAGARANNIGWRIDYFLASKAMMPLVGEASILTQVMGSDHCPVHVKLLG